MERIEWVEVLYGTGIVEVDSQHKVLFERINTLLQALESGVPREQIVAAMDSLGGFAHGHFGFEERLMETVKCSSCRMNCAAHRWFEDNFRHLRLRLEAEGLSDSFSKELTFMLTDWVRRHIQTVDRKLKDVSKP